MKTAQWIAFVGMMVLAALFVSSCSTQAEASAQDETAFTPTARTVPPSGEQPSAPAVPPTGVEEPPAASAPATAEFTLRTIVKDGSLGYIGVGGEIDGIINPDLVVRPGVTIHITLVNGDGMPHDLFLPDFSAHTAYVNKIGSSTDISFTTGDRQPGAYVYYCTVPGHRQAGQEGKLIVAAP